MHERCLMVKKKERVDGDFARVVLAELVPFRQGHLQIRASGFVEKSYSSILQGVRLPIRLPPPGYQRLYQKVRVSKILYQSSRSCGHVSV